MATTTLTQKKVKNLTTESPKRLSKIGEFMKKYPKGSLGYIVDYKAVLK
jgi:hypothetical protein